MVEMKQKTIYPGQDLPGLRQVDPDFRPQFTDQFVNFPRLLSDGKPQSNSRLDLSRDSHGDEPLVAFIPSQLLQLTSSVKNDEAGELVQAVRILLPDRQHQIAYEMTKHTPTSVMLNNWYRLSWSAWLESVDTTAGFVRSTNNYACQEDHWLRSSPAADPVRLFGRLKWNHTTCQHYLVDFDPFTLDCIGLWSALPDGMVKNHSTPIGLPVRVCDDGMPYPLVDSSVVLVNPRLVYSHEMCKTRHDRPYYLLGDAIVQLDMTLPDPVGNDVSVNPLPGFPTHTAVVHLTSWGKLFCTSASHSESRWLLPVQCFDVTDRQRLLKLRLTASPLVLQWLPVLRAHLEYQLTWQELEPNSTATDWRTCRLLHVQPLPSDTKSQEALLSVSSLSSWMQHQRRLDSGNQTSRPNTPFLSVQGLVIHRHPVDDGWSLWLADCSPVWTESSDLSCSSIDLWEDATSPRHAASPTLVTPVHCRVDSLVQLRVPSHLVRLLHWPCPLVHITVGPVSVDWNTWILVATDESSLFVNNHLSLQTSFHDILRLTVCVPNGSKIGRVCSCLPELDSLSSMDANSECPPFGWIRPADAQAGDDGQVFSARVLVTKCLEFRCSLDSTTITTSTTTMAPLPNGSGSALVQLGSPGQKNSTRPADAPFSYLTETSVGQTSLDMAQLMFGFDRASWHRLCGQLVAVLTNIITSPPPITTKPYSSSSAQMVLQFPGAPSSPLETALTAYLNSPNFLRFHYFLLLRRPRSSGSSVVRRRACWRLRGARLASAEDQTKHQLVNCIVPPLPYFELVSVNPA